MGCDLPMGVDSAIPAWLHTRELTISRYNPILDLLRPKAKVLGSVREA